MHSIGKRLSEIEQVLFGRKRDSQHGVSLAWSDWSMTGRHKSQSNDALEEEIRNASEPQLRSLDLVMQMDDTVPYAE